MNPLKLLPFSRRVAFVYVVVICALFILHFKVADDFTYKYVKYDSFLQCRFGCFRDTEFYKLFSLNRRQSIRSTRLTATAKNNSDLKKDSFNTNSVSKPLPGIAAVVLGNYSGENIPSQGNNSYHKYRNGINSIDEDEEDVSNQLYTPPHGGTKIRRFPQSVIIGFTKCGTRALIEFLSLHPYIRVAKNEVHFYDRDENFRLGYDWYMEQMPRSYSNQVTMEKTPAYVLTERARDEMVKISPGVKLILLVRDPVVRLVSQYILRFRVNKDEDEDRPISAIYTNFTTGKFDPDLRPVDIGNYQKHINMWLERFPFKQMLIINSEDLTRQPLYTIKKVERFLKIPSLFTEKNVYFNKTSGFYCPRDFGPAAEPQCLGKTKGIKHPRLLPEEKAMLYRYYKQYNEKLFNLIGYRMNWTEGEWGKQE